MQGTSPATQSLKYQLNPPTLNMWANKIMQQWDLSLEAGLQNARFFQSRPPKYFKRVDEDSYKHFRQVMQILDCVILDIQTVQYKPKILVCSLLYLILGTPPPTQASSSTNSPARRSPPSSPGPPGSSWRRATSTPCSASSWWRVSDCRCSKFYPACSTWPPSSRCR